MPASWLWELPTSNLALDKNSTWGKTKDGKKNKSCQSFRLRVHAHFRLPCTKWIEKCQNTIITPAVFYYPLVTPPPLSGILVELPLEDRTCPRVVVVVVGFFFCFFFGYIRFGHLISCRPLLWPSSGKFSVHLVSGRLWVRSPISPDPRLRNSLFYVRFYTFNSFKYFKTIGIFNLMIRKFISFSAVKYQVLSIE